MEYDDDDDDDDGRMGVRNEGNESVAENAKLGSSGKSWNEGERVRQRIRRREREREEGRERERRRELWKHQKDG